MKYLYLKMASVAMIVALAGCISDPKYLEEDFGSSVKQMIAAQIYDPQTASNPDNEPPLIVDGVIIGYGVQAYYEKAKLKDEAVTGFTFVLE